ncbi:MAG: carboxypeptidase regulatory-like domain-containing protein [Crocinitomicaceae bacterium]|nr:carboxypeptidase regulatory-like domain-containing protein [Crocinitomicaceae bacterium]
MQRRFYLLLLLVFLSFSAAVAQNSGTLKGKVTDKDTKEPLPFVNVILFLNGTLVTGGTTDIDGEYTIKPIDPGTYEVRFQFVGYQPVSQTNVPIQAGKIQFVNQEMSSGVELETIEIVEFKVPLIDKDGGASGGTVTREEIAKMPGRDALGLAQTVAGVSSAGTGGGISIRGARTNSTWVYIDGIKVRGSTSLPKSAVEEISVITGGIPANIGDATGGVINISLRSASSKYTGGVEVISSGFKSGETAVGLDRYGYNLIEGSASGPIFFKKDSAGNNVRPILGFFVSGNYTDILDPSAAFGGVYRMNEDARQAILQNPLRQNVQPDGSVNGALYNADFLNSSNFSKVKTRLNVRRRAANLVAKFDVNTSETVTLTFGGTAAFSRDHNFDYDNMLMNWENNQEETSLDWRAYAKFSQRFKNSEEEGTANNLKNVFYSIMADYSSSFDRVQDDTHKDSFFRYGHVGYFDITRRPSYTIAGDGSYFEQSGWQDVNVNFRPSEYNPDLAAITNQFFSLFETSPYVNEVLSGADPIITDVQFYDSNLNSFISETAAIGNDPYSSLFNVQAGNGMINGQQPSDTYSLWSYIGSQGNNYSVVNQKQFRVSGTGSADIKDHALQIGFEFEQRRDAGYFLAPVGLWQLARQYTNFHNQELDRDNVSYFTNESTLYANYGNIVGSDQFEFDYNLRTALGLNPNGPEFINTDALSPDFLSVDMFGASDLLNSGNNYVTYYGYDHKGHKLNKRPTIDDFFSQRYNLGNMNNSYASRSVGAFEPIYISGYVMDKFAFDDLIFNVGLRVDRYDANQYVPKDPYVISEAFTAGEVNFGDFNTSRPTNIGDDFVVYVDDLKNPTSITGYRDGSVWYNAEGQEVTDPLTSVASGGKVNPFLKVDPDAELTGGAFREYKPAVNFMPRVAFSFPISEEALFFAHYDILTQRPTTSNRFNPVDYLYMENRNVLLNNPDLRPEKTVDYALGFQQVLSRTSSIKVEAFYRELRDMIQVRSFVGAYPSTYRAFGNLDFGTVKGLTLTYDLRRTGNLWMKTSYTLQFADGTGSTTQSQLALINAGLPNLRTVSPFNYDQRHRIVTTVDYRYGGGSDYNGPVWFGKQVFQNTGINLIGNLGSGTPYTPQVNATPITGEISPTTAGSINGARLPWQFTLDANLDRNFTLQFGKDENKKKTANLNVYLWVTNLLNTRNIVGVYRYTGVPDDDGYLAAAQFQSFINAQNSPEAYRNYYGMYVNNPYNLGAPRQMRLGIRLDF